MKLAELKALFGKWAAPLAVGEEKTATLAIRDAALYSRIRPDPEGESLRRQKWSMDADEGAFSLPFEMENDLERPERKE